MVALISTRASNLNDVLNYELAAVPTSMFDEKSGLRISMSKSILKRKHQVEVTNPSIGIRDAVVIAHAIFDRNNTSIKDAICLFMCQRAWDASREYKLTMNAPLPQQQVVLSVTKNNVQLIDLICEKLDDERLKVVVA